MSLQAQNPFGLSPDTSYAGIIINSEIVDLDGDGDMDIVTSGFYGNNFLFFENNNSSTPVFDKSNEVSIFPNPAKNILNIQTYKSFDRIEIIDQLGKIIINKGFYKTLNISTLSKGIYTINLYKGNEKIYKRFSKL